MHIQDVRALPFEARRDRYLRIIAWLQRRYMASGGIVVSRGGRPTLYTCLSYRFAQRYLEI